MPDHHSVDVPNAPKTWLTVTRKAWVAYWDDDVANLARESNLPIIRRLFEMYDENTRLRRVVKASPAVKGSQGQIRMNPLADYLMKLEGAILRLENELGLTPMARLRMGLTLGDAAKSLKELYESDDDAPAAGPRIVDATSGDLAGS